MLDVLGKIGQSTEARVAALKKEHPSSALASWPLMKRKALDFEAALRGKSPKVIAEIKFASPSAGRLALPGKERAVEIAGSYLAAGAAALSILTEPDWFSGSPEYLEAARAKFPKAPLLMKDFLVDPWQCEWARARGADAALLIVALLGPRLKPMLAACKAAGVAALVEVHTEEEMDAALASGATLLGVNSRNLKTLKTDLNVARRLVKMAGKQTLVAESGIDSRAQIDELFGLGYHAFLVGTHFMRQPDPGAGLKELLK
jgi:indole-3-glycerol phosphate synthase